MPVDFYRTVLLPLLVLGAAGAAASWLVLGRLSPRRGRVLFLLLVLAMLVPYLLHALATVEYVRHFGPPAEATAGLYPGLMRFAVVTVVAVVAVWLLGAASLRVMPALAGAAPLVMALLYWRALLPMVFEDAPFPVEVDNVPLIWLFTFSMVGALVLFAASARVPRWRGGGGGGGS